jgi:hypothetical protein
MRFRVPFLASVIVLFLAFTCVATTATQAALFFVENNGTHTVVSLWVSPTWSDRYWGHDVLGDDVLRPGYDVREYVAACPADIRVLYDDGQVLTQYGLSTCLYNLELDY